MVPRVATWLVSCWAKLNIGRHKMAENKIARRRIDGLLDKVGSLSIQTRAGEVVALAGVKNCGLSERTGVKNCKKEKTLPLITRMNMIRRALEKLRTFLDRNGLT